MSGHFLLTAGFIIVLPYILSSIGHIKRFIPLVVLQILMGVLLGPSLFGYLSPSAYQFLFSKETLSQIEIIGQFSLIFLGLLIGLHIDVNELVKGGYKKHALIGLMSVITPFLLTVPVAVMLAYSFPTLMGSAASVLSFTLSIALASSVTALPVLGAILMETGMMQKVEGKLAILFASVNDIFLWILLVIIVGVTAVQSNPISDLLKHIAVLCTFLFALFAIVKPLFEKHFKQQTHFGNLQLGLVVSGALFSGFIAEIGGLQPILGAFLFGVIVPKKITEGLVSMLEPVVSVLLVPFFLILAGLKITINAASIEIWVIFVAITAISMIGNFTGIALPAYKAGFSRDTSVLLGIFMQCKGLMEIVVLNTFLSAHILSQNGYSGMVLMAVFTTSLTQPLTILYTTRMKSRLVRPLRAI